MIKFLAGIILYLLIISTFFGFVVSEKMSDELSGINTEIYKGDFVDFSGTTNFNALIDQSSLVSQSWNIVNNVLIYNDTYSALKGIHPIFFKGIQPNIDNEYKVKYYFNNSEDLNFEIWVTDGGIYDEHSFILKYDKTNLKMYNPYIHSIIGEYFQTEMFSIPISLTGIHTITTILNPITQKIQIYVDDTLIQDIPTKIRDDYTHYGGIFVPETGTFQVTKIESDITISADTGDHNFLALIGRLMLYTVPEEYMPLIFNIILIKFPIILLGIVIAFYIRGVS